MYTVKEYQRLYKVIRRRALHPRTMKYIGTHVNTTYRYIGRGVIYYISPCNVYLILYDMQEKEATYLGHVPEDLFQQNTFNVHPIEIKLTQLKKLAAISILVTNEVIKEDHPLPF